MDSVYADFTSKAAQGRNMDVEKLEKSAHGRVWSGADALKIGLIDELGGFVQALDYTKTQIGLKPNDPVWLLSYPPPERPVGEIVEDAVERRRPADGYFRDEEIGGGDRPRDRPVQGDFRRHQRPRPPTADGSGDRELMTPAEIRRVM